MLYGDLDETESVDEGKDTISFPATTQRSIGEGGPTVSLTSSQPYQDARSDSLQRHRQRW